MTQHQPTLTSPADSLITTGEQAYYRGEFDSAGIVWRQALTAALPDDSLTEPRALTWLGLAAYRQGNYQTARQLGERALALKHERGLRSELAKSYNALGLLAWNEGRLADAGAHFRSTIELATEQGDRELVAKAGNNLGLLQTELGAFDQARGNFVAARRAGRGLGDAKMEGGALNNLGMLDVWLGNHDRALVSLLEAHQLYRQAGYETGEENVFGQLATVYAARGEPQLAFAALDSALAIARKQGMRAQVASNLETLAGVYETFGDGQRALDTYAQAGVINRELDLQVEQANGLRSQAGIRFDAGLHGPARANADQALAIHRRTGAQFEELHDLLLLVEIAARQGSANASLRYLRNAQRLAAQLQVPIARARVALTRARLADASGDGRAVLRVLDSATPDLTASLSRSTWEVEGLRSRAHASMGALDSAAAAGRRAVAAVERVRGGLGSSPLQSAYLTTKATIYADLVLVLLRQGRTDEAFMVADGARGRALLQHLPSLRERVRQESSAHQLAESEALLRRIDALLIRLDEADETPPEERGPEGSAIRGELAGRLEEARSEYESRLTRLTAHGADAELLGGRVASAGAVRSALRPDEAMLEYLVTSDRVLIFVLTRSSLRIIQSTVAEPDLLARVRLARDLFAQPGAAPEDSREVAEALHDVLLRPVEASGALAGTRHILIVPHGPLNYLPFAALRNRTTGRPLVQDYSVWSVPSGSALPGLRRSSRAIPATMGARGVAYVPLLDQLPATRAEATSFLRNMPRSQVRRGEAASESDLRRALARGDVVHIASHGVLNPINPLFSRIELARRGSQADDDGRLEAHELLDLSIRSPLVYLSGCETGLGLAWSTDFAGGEDYTTLAQGFLYAGARNVVATLWRIEDAGAAVFAGRFYRQLQQLAPREALAAAQREMRQDPQFSAPYYWAAYFLTGEGS